MKQFFSTVSSLTLLFCLVSQNGFSMDMKEENSLSDLRGAGASSRLKGKEKEGVSLKYETFDAADSDLRKKLPLFLKMVESAQKKFSKRESSLEDFLTVFNSCMDKLKTPFKLVFDDASHVTLLDVPFLGEGEMTFLSLFGYEENIPETREGKAFKKRQKEALSAFWENPRGYLSEQEGKVEIGCIIDLAKIVCETTIGLLSCKGKVVSNPLEQEEIHILSIKAYQKYFTYIDSLNERMTDGKSLDMVLRKKAQGLNEIYPLLQNLQRFYISQNRKVDYLQSMRLHRKYLELELKEEIFYYEMFPKNQEEIIALKLAEIEASLAALSESALVEATNYCTLKQYETARNVLEEVRSYAQKIKKISPSSSLLKDKNEKIEELTSVIEKQENSQVLKRKLRPEKPKFVEKMVEGTTYSKHKELMSLIKSALIDKQDFSEQELRDLQKEVLVFERGVLEEENGTPLSSEQVVRFYEKYNEQLQKNADALIMGTYAFIKVFIAGGQFENALAHINGFKAVYNGIDKDHIFKDLDVRRALIKAFQGDSAEFLVLVEAYCSDQAQTAKQKDRRKEEKEKAHASAARAAQKKSAHSKSLNELQSAPSSLEEKKKLRTPPVFEDSSYTISLAASEIAPSTEEEKEEKRKRHHEKLEERKKELEQEALKGQRAAAVVDEDAEEAREGAQAEAAAAREDSWFPFGKNIELKTLQKRVDLQIEQNSWNFTKTDLERYYEEFGCKVSQNGRHTKAALPAYKDVRLPDGTPLSVMFEERDTEYEGGSFTLPNWQDQVPFYLRKQILKARGKIQAYSDLLDKAALLQSEQGREE